MYTYSYSYTQHGYLVYSYNNMIQQVDILILISKNQALQILYLKHCVVI